MLLVGVTPWVISAPEKTFERGVQFVESGKIRTESEGEMNRRPADGMAARRVRASECVRVNASAPPRRVRFRHLRPYTGWGSHRPAEPAIPFMIPDTWRFCTVLYIKQHGCGEMALGMAAVVVVVVVGGWLLGTHDFTIFT